LFNPPIIADVEAKSSNKNNSKQKKDSSLETAKVRNDHGLKNNDGQNFNKKHGVIVHFGPAGVQQGHTNPLGIPPQPTDVEVTYLHPSGVEFNVGLIPGITAGLRYRGGSYLYGSVGGGLILSAQGIGPGLYSAVGISFMRNWPVTIEAEFKQAAALAMGMGETHITMPYAFRLGAGVYF
jgi:hypothetical protein